MKKILLDLKSKIEKKDESRYKDLVKKIDSHIHDIKEAARVRNERNAQSNRTTTPTGSSQSTLYQKWCEQSNTDC